MIRKLATLTLLLTILSAPFLIAWRALPSGGGAQSATGTAIYHAFGDSITAASGNAQGKTYPQIIAAAENLTVTNYAVSGYFSSNMNTGQVLPHEYPLAANTQYYTIMIGTNDANECSTLAGQEGEYFCDVNWVTGSYVDNLMAALTWLGTPDTNKISPNNSSLCSNSGTGWSVGTAANDSPFYPASASMLGQTVGASLQCTVTVNSSGILYAWVAGNVYATAFSYQLDGGTTTTYPHTNNPGATVVRFTGLTPGSHTLKIIVGTDGMGHTGIYVGSFATAPTSVPTCCKIFIAGVMRQEYEAIANTNAATAVGSPTLSFASTPTPLNTNNLGQNTPLQDVTNPAAIPYTCAGQDNCDNTRVSSYTSTTLTLMANVAAPGVGSGDTIWFAHYGDTLAYYNQVASVVSTLQSTDNINVTFVDIRNCSNPNNCVNSTTDMTNQLHPSISGVNHLANAFEAVWH